MRFSTLADTPKEIKAAQDGFESCRGYIRKLISQRVDLRYTPEFQFIYDKGIKHAADVDRVLEEIKKLKPAPDVVTGMSFYKSVLKAIGHHRKFLLTTHHNPDADAVSSVLAMALFLKSKGKKLQVLNEDACPSWLKFLPATSMLKKAAYLRRVDYEAAIVLDCGHLDGWVELKSLSRKAGL